MKKNAFYIFFGLLGVFLIVVSSLSIESSSAITAKVESEKTAISYRKAVQIKKLYVSAGQRVNRGDTLLIVTRPDLLLDQAKLENEKLILESEAKRLRSDYHSKVSLLNVEESGKLVRIQANIDHLESELNYQEALNQNLRNLSSSQRDSLEEILDHSPDKIRLDSYRKEYSNLQEYYRSEKRRMGILLEDDLHSVQLKIENLNRDFEELSIEQKALVQIAPFSGTIGTVNVQLEELLPEFTTIMTLFAEHPTKIKAYANIDSEYVLTTGQNVVIEAANRYYQIEGTILEVGARIVEYQNPSNPTGLPLWGKEIFISLPQDNDFLYGEQVLVYPPSE